MNGSASGLIFGFFSSCFSASWANLVHVTRVMNLHLRLFRPLLRRRSFNERLGQRPDLWIFLQLLQRVLGKFGPWHAWGVFVRVQAENDAVVVVRNHVAGHRRAVGQRKRVRANGDKQSAKPETENCPKDSAHEKLLTNANAARKKIQQ